MYEYINVSYPSDASLISECLLYTLLNYRITKLEVILYTEHIQVSETS